MTHAFLLLCLLTAACDRSPTEPTKPCVFATYLETVTPPVRTHTPAPHYTEDARQARIQGIVIVSCVINCEGRVDDLRIVKALYPSLDDEVLRTLSSWRFIPAKQAGRRVAVYYTLTVNFRLQGDEPSVSVTATAAAGF
ncbi:MAG: energy transducer TonB [bacterium]|nr:energy transducer TonB [bacterium]